MRSSIFGGSVSRAGAFVRGAAFENTDSHHAVGFVRGEVGHGGADVELWRGMATMLGRADVQLFVVRRNGFSLGRVAIFKASVLRIAFAGTAEFITHQGI